MHKVIFLDIDGVLNSQSWLDTKGFVYPYKIPEHEKFDPKAVKILSKIIYLTDAKIIFSSTWRLDFSSQELAKMIREFAPFPPRTFGGCTPDLKLKENRGDEIELFIKDKGKSISSYCILDDAPIDKFTKPQIKNHLVSTDYDRGLKQKHITEVIRVLKS